MESKDGLKDINQPDNVKKENISTNTNNDQNASTTTTTVSTKANLEPSATVKFVLMPLGQVVTLAKPLKTRINDFLTQFSNELKIEQEFLQIIHSVTSKSTSKN
jgi:hypothetical protein